MWGHCGLFGGHVGVMWSTWGHAVGRGGCRVGVACGSRVGSRLGEVWCPLVSLGSFGSFCVICDLSVFCVILYFSLSLSPWVIFG